jgi:hypothetical protein
MAIKTRILLCLSILVLFIMANENSYASDTVTVVTFSQKYEGVTYKISRQGNQLILFQPDWQTTVDISDIRFIFDKSGNNITNEILGDPVAAQDSIPQSPQGDSINVNSFTGPSTITIITRSAKYRNVEYLIDSANKKLEIEQDGWKSEIKYSDIQSVLDPDGNDITSRILEGKSASPGDTLTHNREISAKKKRSNRPKNESWVSENSEAITKARARLWNVGISGTANYTIPASTYYKGIDPGIGYEGVINFAINYEVALRLSISRTGLKAGNNIQIYSENPYVSVLEQNATFESMRYNIGAEYYQSIDRQNRDLNMWYAYSAIGSITHKMKIKATLINNQTHQTAPYSDVYSETKVDLIFGVGVIKSIQKHLGVEFSASCDIVSLGEDPDKKATFFEDNIVYAYIFDFKMGLTGLF